MPTFVARIFRVRTSQALIFRTRSKSALVRVRNEERILARAFPDYAAYQARTPMLVPGAKLLAAHLWGVARSAHRSGPRPNLTAIADRSPAAGE